MADPIKHVLVGSTNYDIYDQRIKQISATDITVSQADTTTTFIITAATDSELTNGALLLVKCTDTLVVTSTYPKADIKYGSSGIAHHVSDSATATASDVSTYFVAGKMLLLSYNTDDSYWHLLSTGGSGGGSYTAGTGIDITNNVISTDDVPTEDLASDMTFTPTNTVGGCIKGTTYSNKSVKELLEQILCPYVAFSFSSIATTPSATIYEYGAAKTVTAVKPTFTSGSRSISSVKIGSTSGGSDLYEGTSATSGTNITLTTSKSLDGLTSTNIYCTLSDGTTTLTRYATFTFSQYNYYAVSSSTTPPTSGTAIGTGTQKDITTTDNTYIWFMCPSSKTKIQQYSMSMWNDLATTSGGTVTFTTSTGQSLTYYTYRTDMMMAATGTYRIS